MLLVEDLVPHLAEAAKDEEVRRLILLNGEVEACQHQVVVNGAGRRVEGELWPPGAGDRDHHRVFQLSLEQHHLGRGRQVADIKSYRKPHQHAGRGR
jgi:hypothetical protein